MLDATTPDGNNDSPGTMLAPAELVDAAEATLPALAAELEAPAAIPFNPEPAAPVVQDGDDGGVHDPANVVVEDEADNDERLIRAVMPVVFDAMDDAARYYAATPPPAMKQASATTLARSLLMQHGVEPGDRVDRLSGLIGRGVCDVQEAPHDPEQPEPEPEPEPEPPTVAELARAVAAGKAEVAPALATMATSTPEEGADILARIERLRGAVVELESLLPDRPVFAADVRELATPHAVEDPRSAPPPVATAVPRLIVPAALLGVGMLAQVGAFAILALQSRPATMRD